MHPYEVQDGSVDLGQMLLTQIDRLGVARVHAIYFIEVMSGFSAFGALVVHSTTSHLTIMWLDFSLFTWPHLFRLDKAR